jgi:hypothetical protein
MSEAVRAMTTNGGPAEQHINFRGVAEGKPIPYENIVLNRDVVFLRHDFHHTEESVSGGAPEVETRYYTGFLTQRDGLHFYFVQFSLVGDRSPASPAIPGTILLDPGGRAANPETYDSRTMTFWKMGELYIEGA